MRVTFHIGLHSTDEDRALTCLLKNRKSLALEGSAIPAPGRFRPVLREAMIALKGSPASEDTQERLLDAVIDTDRPRHVLFSSDSFLCVPAKSVAGDRFYPQVGERAVWIRQLFPDNPAKMCLALRNPATFLPAIFARSSEGESFDAFLARVNPEALQWSDMLSRLRAVLPDTEVVVWCHEDAPVLWPEILALLAGRTDGLARDLKGWDDFIGELMPAEALEKLRSYLQSHPPRDTAHQRRVIAAFLDRFADDDAVMEDLDFPGWTQERVTGLTLRYEEDLVRIAGMPGITFLRP